MRSDFVQIALYSIVLIVMSAAQDMLPAVFGVKLPLIALVAFYLACTREVVPAAIGAVAAGILFDALSDLPVFCTSGFLLVVCLFVRICGGNSAVRGNSIHQSRPGTSSPISGAIGMASVSPLLLLWGKLWTGHLGDNVLESAGEIVLAAAFGAVVGLVFFLFMPWLEKHTGAQPLPERTRRFG